MRWLVAQFMHETNTFSTIHPGSREFSERELLMGGEIAEGRRGTHSHIGAFIDFAESHGIELVWTIAAFATPAGPVQAEFYDWVTQQILEGVTDDIDGVLMALHGAMVAEHHDDGEGVLLEALREKLGPDRPVACSLDYHTNLSAKMVANADVLVGYKTYPHVDMYDASYKAAALLMQVCRGEVRPARHARYVPILAMLGATSTFKEPMQSIIARARDIEQDPDVLAVSVFGGFPYADIPDAGMATLVITDGEGRGEELSQELADLLWGAGRSSCTRPFPSPRPCRAP